MMLVNFLFLFFIFEYSIYVQERARPFTETRQI